MASKLKENQKGFTIIEVLIVLAIAGLIMVIVFLAVPALQRNSRNTQRDADASKIGGAAAQCMANRNGQIAECSAQAQLVAVGGLDADKLQQYDGVDTGTAQTDLDTILFGWGFKCDTFGENATDDGASARSGVVVYQKESSGDPTNRCVDI